MKVTAIQRVLMAAALGLTVLVAVALCNYFTLLAGFLAGFVWYSYMHVILHHRWAMKILPGISRYHLHHHCGNPHNCFGVSIRFWDDVFGTTPHGRAAITQRVLDFYYKKRRRGVAH